MHTLLGHVSDDAKDLIARIQSLNNGDGVWICHQNSLFFFYGWSVKNQHVFNNQRFIFMLLVMDFSG
jgi:hypothetical protein